MRFDCNWLELFRAGVNVARARDRCVDHEERSRVGTNLRGGGQLDLAPGTVFLLLHTLSLRNARTVPSYDVFLWIAKKHGKGLKSYIAVMLTEVRLSNI